MELRFNFIIVGAGIAGLYAAYRLLQNSISPANIALIEGSSRLGGKLYTVASPGGPVNLGAGRYNDQQHPLLAKLLSELKLQSIPHQAVNLAQPAWLNYQSLAAMQKQLAQGKEMDNFRGFLAKHYGEQYVADLAFAGYATLLQDSMPAGEALRILIQHPEFSDASIGRWLEPIAGFGGLIEQLRIKLIQMGIKIYTQAMVKSVEQLGAAYQLHVNFSADDSHLIITSDHIVQATANLEHLATILTSEMAFINISRVPVPLFKAYFCFSQAWWSLDSPNTNDKAVVRLDTSNSKLGKLYLDTRKKMLWIYNDGDVARYWHQRSSCKEFAELVMETVANTIGVNMPSPELLLWQQQQFWPRGVDFWCSKHQQQQCRTMRKIMSKYKRIHLVASSFAERSGWVEGALENVEQMLQSLQKQSSNEPFVASEAI